MRRAGKRVKKTGSKSEAPAQRSRKRRVRPRIRANARKAKIKKQPMPKPPTRRKVSTEATAAASEEAQQEVNRIRSHFDRLGTEAQLSVVYSTIGNIDSQLTDLPFKIESLRDRGYVHSGQLEDKLEALDDRWDEVRPRVESALRNHVRRLDEALDEAERHVGKLRATNAASLKAADTAIDGLSDRVGSARRAVESLYDGLEDGLYQVESEIRQVTKMLDELDQSPEVRLRDTEGPLLAVETQWQQNDDGGPDGILFLTDQRLLFEQREEVVTKKVLGIFKADSEKIQKLLLDVDIHEVESVSHKEEGGFLGMGKDDILELVFAASAPVSRARFHLKGQDSADWAATIKRVETGGIDADRADEYVEEIGTAAEAAASFPTQCPTCFAPVPTPPRGVTSVTCEFCSTVITPSHTGGEE
jgi:phage shock protein A